MAPKGTKICGNFMVIPTSRQVTISLGSMDISAGRLGVAFESKGLSSVSTGTPTIAGRRTRVFCSYAARPPLSASRSWTVANPLATSAVFDLKIFVVFASIENGKKCWTHRWGRITFRMACCYTKIIGLFDSTEFATPFSIPSSHPSAVLIFFPVNSKIAIIDTFHGWSHRWVEGSRI